MIINFYFFNEKVTTEPSRIMKKKNEISP